MAADATFLTLLENLCENFGFDQIVDVGCGEVTWLDQSEVTFEYLGIDIVDAIVEKNRKKYDSRKILFDCRDIIRENIPKCDLILCLNCFCFFSYYDILSALERLKENNSDAYVLLTTYPNMIQNNETATGIKRKINFQLYPFYFPDPIQLLTMTLKMAPI